MHLAQPEVQVHACLPSPTAMARSRKEVEGNVLVITHEAGPVSAAGRAVRNKWSLPSRAHSTVGESGFFMQEDGGLGHRPERVVGKKRGSGEGGAWEAPLRTGHEVCLEGLPGVCGSFLVRQRWDVGRSSEGISHREEALCHAQVQEAPYPPQVYKPPYLPRPRLYLAEMTPSEQL